MFRTKLIRIGLVSATIIAGGGLAVSKLSDKQYSKASEEIGRFEPKTKWDFNWDKREPSSLIKPKKHHSLANIKEKSTTEQNAGLKSQDDLELIKKHTPKANRHLFLIRHGQYEIKEKESEKKVLTQLGREQAELTGKFLNELALGRFKYTKLHHSTLIRAVQTADIIKSQLPSDIPVHVDPLLCEGSPIPPEPPIGRWRPELDVFQDGPRIEAAFRKYFHRAAVEQTEDSFEVIVCHANVIRFFFCRALQFPAEAWLRFDLGHGSITHITIRPDGRVLCRMLGENGFQPISKMTVS